MLLNDYMIACYLATLTQHLNTLQRDHLGCDVYIMGDVQVFGQTKYAVSSLYLQNSLPNCRNIQRNLAKITSFLFIISQADPPLQVHKQHKKVFLKATKDTKSTCICHTIINVIFLLLSPSSLLYKHNPTLRWPL